MSNIETVNNIKINLGGTQGPMGITRAEFDALNKGGPAGVYDNLETLQNAEDADKTRIYLTLDNGNWNYWNGSLWVSGGVYQAVNPADFVKKTNLFIVNNAIISNEHPYVGYDAEGNQIEKIETSTKEDAFVTSEYIPIETGKTYETAQNITYTLLFYNSSKEFMYGYSGSNIVGIAVGNATYARIAGGSSSKNKLFLREKTNDEYIFNNKYVKLEDNSIDVNKIDFIKNKNLFNMKNVILSNSYPYVDFSTEEETYGKKIEKIKNEKRLMATSDYIEIEGGETYEAGTYNLLFYDELKNFLYGVSAQSNTNNNNPYYIPQALSTAPLNARYARITGEVNNVPKMYLIKRSLNKIITYEGSNYLNSNVLEGDISSLYIRNYSNQDIVRADNIPNNNIYPEHTTFISSNNLCNLLQTFRGPHPNFNVNEDNEYTEFYSPEKEGQGYWTTDFIEIKPNTKYKAHSGALLFYDENYTLIKAKGNSNDSFGLEKFNVVDTSPENAKYARLWEYSWGRNALCLVEYDKPSYELDKKVFGEIFNKQENLISNNIIPNKFKDSDYGLTLMDNFYFLGRWEKRQLRGTDCVCTGYNGGKIFTKIENTSSITLKFVAPTKESENYTILYKLDNNEYVKETINSSKYNIVISNIENRCEHYVEIVINSSSYEINTFTTSSNSAGFIGIDTDGNIKQIIPQNKKIFFIGDSITAGAYVGAGNNYCAITSRLLNCQDMRIGISGIGILRPWGEFPSVAGKKINGETPTEYQFNSYIDFVRENVKEQSQVPDIVVINLGTNDFEYNEEEFKPAFKSVIERLKNKYIGINIFILRPLNGAKATSIKAVSKETKCTYIDTSNWGGITFVDGIHPDEEGSKVFGQYLANVLLNYFGKSYFLV
ncbi:SGNH/GDSL hydrolase family protein [Megamonas funiformis]|uniref:SGNH/GDSL hydrolase family protein n=1 Tax=Megamonas funiformis TaxID=437897 RepID=UPI004028090E